MPFFFLAKDKIDAWAGRLAEEYRVYFPGVRESRVHFSRYGPGKGSPKSQTPDSKSGETQRTWALERIRAVEPIKGLLFSPRETVARFPDPGPQSGKDSRQVIIGAKNCDMMPLQVHQKTFLEREQVDPYYRQRRSETIIVSADCPYPEDSCFCSLLGLAPYVESGSDVNLTALENGYLVEPISATGNDLVFGRDKPFRPATEGEVETRDLLRRQAVAKLREVNPNPWPKDLPDRIERSKEDKFWRAAGRDCVECFACLMTCPTCFCYLLYDQAAANGTNPKPEILSPKGRFDLTATEGEQRTANPEQPATGFDRIKVWDACYYEGYARVGGGANARPRMWERFRNRFHCKWMNCTRDWGFHSCSGCGRCFTSCMGKIDIRDILGKL